MNLSSSSLNSIRYQITNYDLFPNHDGKVNTVPYVILLLISAIPALTNISYIIVCFRIFSKEFNKLLILCLCLSGSILGLSTVWYTLVSIFRSVLFSPLSCSFSTFLMSFGLCLSYSFLFILNLASYLTVRSYNYGIKNKLDNIKFQLFCSVFICSCLISCSTWVIPRSPVLKACNTESLFGEYYNIYISVVIGPVGLLLLDTLITSVLAIKQIYIFSKKIGSKLPFSRSNKIGCQIVDDKIETSISHQENDLRVFTLFSQILDDDDQNDGIETMTSEPSRIHTSMIEDKNRFKQAVPGRKISFNQKAGAIKPTYLARPQSITNDTEAASPKHVKIAWSTWEDDEQAAIGATTSGHYRNRSSMTMDNNRTKQAMPGCKISINKNIGTIEQTSKARRQSLTFDNGSASTKHLKLRWKSWEKYAFTTNLLITFTTVLLTGPFIGVMLISIVLNDIPARAGIYTFVLFSLNNAINPFIYAWRIPEIRQELKNICRQSEAQR